MFANYPQGFFDFLYQSCYDMLILSSRANTFFCSLDMVLNSLFYIVDLRILKALLQRSTFKIINSTFLQAEPSQIGLEPFAHSNYAVASILIQLPRSENGFSPKGQSGLCIGSTIVQQKHQNLLTNAQHQLCMFKDRQKRHRHFPVDV